MGTEGHPHQGEPSGQDPHYGEGGPATSGADDPGKALSEAERRARESGRAAEEKAGEGGDSAGMGGSN